MLHRAAPLAPRTLDLGLFGAAHAARRIARAARALGVHVHVLPSPRPTTHTARGADGGVTAVYADAWTDPLVLAPLAARCDVVTAVAEHVPAATLAAAAAFASVRPAPTLLGVAQDRAREKAWLDVRAGHAAPWRVARSAAELGEAVAALLAVDDPGAPAACMLKPLVRHPDGAPPLRVDDPAAALAAWHALGGRDVLVERALAIDTELTVLVARTPGGALAVHPVAMNHREGGTLAWSVLPAPVPAPIARKAQRLAAFYATRLAVEGLLAVELFVLRDGRLVVNELVPCPHPAFDASDAACETDQYEQLVRAVCDLPLGPPDLVAPAASVPLRAAPFAGVLADAHRAAAGVGDDRPAAHPGLALVAEETPASHPVGDLPGTRVTWHHPPPAAGEPLPPGDMVVGHLTATGETAEDAVARARHAAALLGRAHERSPLVAPAGAGARAPARPRRPDDGPALPPAPVVPGFPWRRRFAVAP